MPKHGRKVRFSKKRVKYISKQNHLKQRDIAELLDRSLNTVKGIYMEEMILPEQLAILGKRFDASVEYLEGKSAVKASELTDGGNISAGRIDEDGYYIPHYKNHDYYDLLVRNQDFSLGGLLNWMEETGIMIDVLNMIDIDLVSCIEILKDKSDLLRRAVIGLVVCLCEGMSEIQIKLTDEHED